MYACLISMELPHKNTHLKRIFHPQLVYHDSITLCVEFFLEFFVWKRCTSSKFKQNKLEIQSCFVPIISNVDDRTYNGPAKRIRLRGVMSHDKRIQFRWVSVLATVTTTLPATEPTETEQEPTAATSAAPNLLNDLFTGKYGF